MRRFRNDWGYLALAGILVLSASGGPAIAQHAGGHASGGHIAGGANQHFDGRYSHNQYYYNHGYTVRTPPAGGVGELAGRDGGRYWFHGGNWYRWGGGRWVVWGAPIGLFVPFLPWYFTTVWWDGVPYYYANDVYYLWNNDLNQYAVVAPPEGIESGGSTQTPASDQLFVYPQHGQSEEQQSKDRYECHRSAVDTSGFDPTQAGSGAAPGALDKRNEYFRARVACLESRGYTVK